MFSLFRRSTTVVELTLKYHAPKPVLFGKQHKYA